MTFEIGFRIIYKVAQRNIRCWVVKNKKTRKDKIMGIDLNKMKAKLESLSGGRKSSTEFWRPEDGENNVRIVPTPDGDPFKDYWFHYNLGTSGFLCPKKNHGDDCPVCNFGNKLWNEGTEESRKQAKDLFAKQRFFSPVLVRGQESQGVKVWGYGKMAYEQLLNIVLDPDYGDITDPEEGNDLKITYGKPPGAQFPRTDLRARPRKTVLCDDAVGGDDRCAELLEKIPDFASLFERKTTEEVSLLLEQYLADEDGREDIEKYSGPVETDADKVSDAFKELLNG